MKIKALHGDFLKVNYSFNVFNVSAYFQNISYQV